MRSLTGCTPWVANPPDPVKDKRLCRACGILDRASRACCWKDKSGLRRTIFVHAGVQLALAIFVSNIYTDQKPKWFLFFEKIFQSPVLGVFP